MSKPLAALVLLAIALRIPALDAGLWYDEIATLVDFGPLPFGALLTTYGSDNNHPLYTLLAWLSIHAFGPSAWALRLPALVFGAASVGMFAVLASRLAPRREALLGTALLAISYHHVWFSQNARGYTALMFFTLAATHFFLERRWLLYGASIALATYTHATGAFVAMAHAIVLLSMFKKRDPAAKGLAVGLGTGALGSLVLYLPVLGEMVEFLTANKQVESEWTSPQWMLRTAAQSFGPAAVVGLALAIVGLTSWWKQDRRLVLAFVGPGVIGAVVMIALGRNLWPRFFFFLFGFAILIAVRGLAVLSKKEWKFEAGALALVVGSLAILPRAYQPKQDFEGARAWVERERKPGEAIMTAGLTVLPYQRWLKTDYVPIDSVEALDRTLAGGGGLLLHTLPTFLESRSPALAAEIERRSSEVARFKGTLGDGDIVVLRFQAGR